jgi:hypothetical protein
MKGRSESPTPSEMRLPDVSARDKSDTDPCPPGPELPTCSRCGLPFGNEPNHCRDWSGGEDIHIPERDRLLARVACREREIGTLRAYHRGSVRKLERIMDSLNDLLEALS